MVKHKKLAELVQRIAGLCQPDKIHWCDGSEQEHQLMLRMMIHSGTAIELTPSLRPNSIYVRSDPADVARVEDRTFICSERQEEAGPTNNWAAPAEMKAMSPSQRSTYCADLEKKRQKLQARINTLNEQRRAYVAQEMKKNMAGNTLDQAIVKTIRAQAGEKNFQFK